MQTNETPTYCPASRQEWRLWLSENHDTGQSIWLIQHKKQSGKPTISWSESVDEALCFGWIDSIRKSVDDDTFMQFFCKRKPNSAWSKINKEKVERLMAEGLMAQAGMDCIETARKNGSWSVLDEVEELTIPEDLETAFKSQPGSMDYFSGLSKSVKKIMLQWVAFAKRPETRQNRINEIAERAALKLKPKHM
jgi:uncharacterized protein YdeI (YjbR/CyaY-like superfamily)